MSIKTASDVARVRREAMEEAAKVAERMSNAIMRNAKRVHDDEDDPDHYDRYEALEFQATLVQEVADRIRRAANVERTDPASRGTYWRGLTTPLQAVFT